MKHDPWLDGIRGLAALYVLGHHAAAEVNPRDLPRWVVEATRWLEHGHQAVAGFIVLSGFSIMRPVARQGTIRGGAWGDLSRRAWQIDFLFPILAMISNQMLVEEIQSTTRLAILMFEAVPGIKALAWLFHQAFEKHFLSVRPAGPVATIIGKRLVRISRGRQARARERPSAIP